MAEGGTSIKNHFNCSICLEEFKSPKLLPCFHTYCVSCLETYIDKHGKDGMFECPLCRAAISVPEGGVTAFQTNFYIEIPTDSSSKVFINCDICKVETLAISRCNECEENFCSTCSNAHLNMKMTRTHKLVELVSMDASQKKKILSKEFCKKHTGQEMLFVCKKCDMVLCVVCKLTEHEIHPTQDIFVEAGTIRQKIGEFLNGQVLNEKLNAMTTLIAAQTEVKQELQDALDSCEKEMHHLQQHFQSLNSIKETLALILDHDSDIDLVRRGREITEKVSVITEEQVPQKNKLDRRVLLTRCNATVPLDTCTKVTAAENWKKNPAVKLDASKFKLLSRFLVPGKGDGVAGIAVTQSGCAWISQHDYGKVFFIDFQGRILRDVNAGAICEFVITNDQEDCIVSCPVLKGAKCITQTGTVSTIAEGLGFSPHGLVLKRNVQCDRPLMMCCTDATGYAGYIGEQDPATETRGCIKAKAFVIAPYALAFHNSSQCLAVADMQYGNVTVFDTNDKVINSTDYSYKVHPCSVSFFNENTLLIVNKHQDIRVFYFNKGADDCLGWSKTEVFMKDRDFTCVTVDDNKNIWLGFASGDVEVYSEGPLH